MSGENQPLLRREPPPFTGFFTFFFGASAAAGLGSTIYQGIQRPVSWPAIAASFLCTAVSAAGLWTERRWSNWSRTENSGTSSTHMVAQRVLSPSPVNDQVLQLLSSLEQKIAALLVADEDDLKQGGDDTIEEDADEAISVSDLSPPPLEQRLRQLIEKTEQLASRFEETTESIQRLKSTVQIFTTQLQSTELATREVSAADSSSSDLLSQLASLQSEIDGLRTPSGSRNASPNRSRHASPSRPVSGVRVVAERDSNS